MRACFVMMMTTDLKVDVNGPFVETRRVGTEWIKPPFLTSSNQFCFSIKGELVKSQAGILSVVLYGYGIWSGERFGERKMLCSCFTLAVA
jgi:hypothetical protein